MNYTFVASVRLGVFVLGRLPHSSAGKVCLSGGCMKYVKCSIVPYLATNILNGMSICCINYFNAP